MFSFSILTISSLLRLFSHRAVECLLLNMFNRERTEARRCSFELERVDGRHPPVGPNGNVPQPLQDVRSSQRVPRGEEESNRHGCCFGCLTDMITCMVLVGYMNDPSAASTRDGWQWQEKYVFVSVRSWLRSYASNFDGLLHLSTVCSRDSKSSRPLAQLPPLLVPSPYAAAVYALMLQ